MSRPGWQWKVQLVTGTAGTSDDGQDKWAAGDVVGQATATTRRAAMLVAEQFLLGSTDPLASVKVEPMRLPVPVEAVILRAAAREWLLENGGKFPESLWFDPRTHKLTRAPMFQDDVEFSAEELERFATEI